MKKIILLGLGFLLLAACKSTLPKSIILRNSCEEERIDEAFIITSSQLKGSDTSLLPAIKNKNGEWIPCQADDIDKDGKWDELAFVYSLQPGETVELQIEWIKKENYPEFIKRTHVRYGKMTSPGKIEILTTDMHDKYNLARGEGYPYQTDGPAWENDKMGFRHYIDGRNVRDVFGKITDKMVMDSVGIREDGTPGDTYHVMNWWGRDIMSGAQSFGLGGIAIQIPDSIIRLGVTREETTDNIDSTRYTMIADGPVRSIFKLDFYGWDVCGTKVNVEETMTIWAGKYGYENVVKTSALPQNAVLITGIVNNFNNMPYIQEQTEKYHIMTTFDKQTYDKVWYLGMSLIIDDTNWKGEMYEAPETGKITTTWCTKLKPGNNGEYHYNCYAAWEITDTRFTNSEYYHNMIRSYAKELTNPIIPELKLMLSD